MDDDLVPAVRRSACLAAMTLPILSVLLMVGTSLLIALDLQENMCPDRPAIPTFVQYAPKGEWMYLREATARSTLRLSRTNLSLALSYLAIDSTQHSPGHRSRHSTPSSPSLQFLSRERWIEEKAGLKVQRWGIKAGKASAEGGNLDGGGKNTVIRLRDFWPKEVFHPGSRVGFSAWQFLDVPEESARKLIAWSRMQSDTFRDRLVGRGLAPPHLGNAKQDSGVGGAVGLYGMRMFGDPSPETDLTPEVLGAQEGAWEVIPPSFAVVVSRGFNATHDREECFEAYELQRRADCQKDRIRSLRTAIISGLIYAVPFLFISLHMGLLSAYASLWLAAYPFDHHLLWVLRMSCLPSSGPDLEAQSRASSHSYGVCADGGGLRKVGGVAPLDKASTGMTFSGKITSLHTSPRRLEFLSKRESKTLLSAVHWLMIMVVFGGPISFMLRGAANSMDGLFTVQFYSMDAFFGKSFQAVLAWQVVCLIYAIAVSYFIGFRKVRKHDLGTDLKCGC